MVPKSFISRDDARILRDVIDLYIETGEPVSSKMIKSRFRLDESTAYVRKVLHRLEEMGLLYKPHVSSGRVPSDEGYRLYVDDIGTVNPVSGRLADRIRRRFGQEWSDVRDVMAATSRLLNEFTNYMGLTVGIMQSRAVVERLDIILLEGRGGLVILSLVPNMTRKVYVEFSKVYPQYVLERAVQVMNERIAGHPLEQAPERLDSFLHEAAGTEREIAAAVTREAEFLFDWPYDFKYCYRGFRYHIDKQELTDPKILQNLVRLMGEKSIMLRVLKNRLESGVSITIGRENKVHELEDFAIVTRRFKAASCDGLLGVLGPTRMSYRLVLALLDTTVEELHNVHIREA
jgi:heat-inducible transcriptional repressor